MSNWNLCQSSGLLASSRVTRSKDEREFYGAGRLDLTACNNLICQRCGQPVRAVDDREPSRDDLEPDELYEQSNWARSADLRPSQVPSRHYGCQCFQATVTASLLIAEANQREDLLTIPWSCDGHPPFGERADLDGVAIDAETDFDRLLRRCLSAEIPPNAPEEWSRHPAIWLCRLHSRLNGSPLQSSLGGALTKAIATSDDLVELTELLTFYLQHPFAPGAEGLQQSLIEHPERFRPDGYEVEEGLEFTALRVVGARYGARLRRGRAPQHGAKAVLRSASLRADLAAATLPILAELDKQWVLDNRLDIARASHSNALAVATWIGIEIPAMEETTVLELLGEGLLVEDEL